MMEQPRDFSKLGIAFCNRISIEHEVPLGIVKGMYQISSYIFMTVMDGRTGEKRELAATLCMVIGFSHILKEVGLPEAKATRLIDVISMYAIEQAVAIRDEGIRTLLAKRAKDAKPSGTPS